MIHFDYVYIDDGWVLTVRDDLTGLILLSDAPSEPNSLHCSQVLFHWFAMFSVPQFMVTDGGSYFVSQLMETLTMH
jgi:hypothetical protein